MQIGLKINILSNCQTVKYCNIWTNSLFHSDTNMFSEIQFFFYNIVSCLSLWYISIFYWYFTLTISLSFFLSFSLSPFSPFPQLIASRFLSSCSKRKTDTQWEVILWAISRSDKLKIILSLSSPWAPTSYGKVEVFYIYQESIPGKIKYSKLNWDTRAH